MHSILGMRKLSLNLLNELPKVKQQDMAEPKPWPTPLGVFWHITGS